MTVEYTRATIADVAAAAGVSRTTVSVSLSGRGRVDERTRERVKAIADALNYRPSVRAQRLRGGTSRTVGLITALSNEVVGGDSHLSFLFALAMPLARILLERGYSTLLLPPVRDGDELDAIDADAVVVIDPRENDPLVATFRARGMQVVTIGDVPGIDVNGVVERGYAEAEVAIDHLVERGARNIAVLSTIEQHSLAATLRRFVRDRTGAVNAHLRLVEVSTQSGEERAYRRTTELLAEQPRLDAVYAPIDVFAVGAARAVLDAGKRIPEDVMIMTNFDGPRAQSAAPSLTALELNLTAIAEAAAQLLIACLSQPQSERRIALAPRPSLRERESTGGFSAIYSRP